MHLASIKRIFWYQHNCMMYVHNIIQSVHSVHGTKFTKIERIYRMVLAIVIDSIWYFWKMTKVGLFPFNRNKTLCKRIENENWKSSPWKARLLIVTISVLEHTVSISKFLNGNLWQLRLFFVSSFRFIFVKDWFCLIFYSQFSNGREK